jgi:hypothetical protein
LSPQSKEPVGHWWINAHVKKCGKGDFDYRVLVVHICENRVILEEFNLTQSLTTDLPRVEREEGKLKEVRLTQPEEADHANLCRNFEGGLANSGHSSNH